MSDWSKTLFLVLLIPVAAFLASGNGMGDPASVSRVVAVTDPEATQLFRPEPSRVRAMVDRAVQALALTNNVGEAWRTFVKPKDVVGIKVYSLPGPNSGTRSTVVAAVIEGLMAAGVPSSNIVVWDRRSLDLRLAGYYTLADKYGVRIAAASQAGYDGAVFYENPLLGNLVWGDSEFGAKAEGTGRRSFVTRLLTKDITRIINIAPMLNHNYAGLSGCLYSLSTGSVDNTLRFEGDSSRLATAIPEIYALPAISDKVALNIADGLLAQYEGGERTMLHYSVPLNEIRMSRDPVALDVLSLNDLDRIRTTPVPTNRTKQRRELYSNAALLELGVAEPRLISLERLAP